MTRRSAALAALVLGCSGAQGASTLGPPPPEPPLPNGTMATAAMLTRTVESTGALGCGQTAWYSIALASTAPVTVTILGQAQESALGATASVDVVAANGIALGQVLIPVYARSPEWDPREQSFQPPLPGTYYLRVQEDPQSCQRLAFRLLIR